MDIVDSVSVGDVLLCSVKKEEGDDQDEMAETTPPVVARPVSLPSSLADDEVSVPPAPPAHPPEAPFSSCQQQQQQPFSSSSSSISSAAVDNASGGESSSAVPMAPQRDDDHSATEMISQSAPLTTVSSKSLDTAQHQPASEHLVSGFLIVGFKRLEHMQDWIVKHEANRQAVAEACSAKRMEINCVRLKKEKASKKAHRAKKNASSKERDKAAAASTAAAAMDSGDQTTPMAADGLRKSSVEVGRLDGLPPLERLVKTEELDNFDSSPAAVHPSSANSSAKRSGSPTSRVDYDHWSARLESSADGGSKMAAKREASDQEVRPAKLTRLDSSSPKAPPPSVEVDCKEALSPATSRAPKSMPNASTSSCTLSTEWSRAGGGSVRRESGLSSSSSGAAGGKTTTTTTTAAAANDLEQRLFLASKGSTATPAYFHTEMHQHQHTHMHQYPFLPPFFAPSIGFPAYATLPGFAYPPPPAAAAAPNGLTVPMLGKRKGKWCAKHVEIAWLIYRKVRLGARKGDSLADGEAQQRVASDGSKVAAGIVEGKQEEKHSGSPARPSFHNRVTPVVMNGIGDKKEPLPRFLIDPALGMAQEELASKRRELHEQLLTSTIPPPAGPFAATGTAAGQDGSLTSGLLAPSLRPPMPLPFMLGGADASTLPAFAQSLNDRLLSQSVVQPPSSPWTLPGAIAGGIPLMPAMSRGMQDHLRDGGQLTAGLQFGAPVPPTVGSSLDLLRPFSLDPGYLARLQPPIADGGMFRSAGLDSLLLERNEQLLRFQEQMAAAAVVASNIGMDGGLASSSSSSASAGQQQQQLALELERTMNGARGAAAIPPTVGAPFDPAVISNLLHAERVDLENRSRLLAARGSLQDAAMTVAGATDPFLGHRLAMLGAGGAAVVPPSGLTEPFGRVFGQAALTNHLLQSASAGSGAAGASMVGLGPSLVAAGAPKFPHSFSSTLEQLARQKREAMVLTPTGHRS
uniref:Uncharacterized protein n=1 Tax=Trichuris muris TaxID=70415 RepID=A0A5S6QUM8_TRIMR